MRATSTTFGISSDADPDAPVEIEYADLNGLEEFVVLPDAAGFLAGAFATGLEGVLALELFGLYDEFLDLEFEADDLSGPLRIVSHEKTNKEKIIRSV